MLLAFNLYASVWINQSDDNWSLLCPFTTSTVAVKTVAGYWIIGFYKVSLNKTSIIWGCFEIPQHFILNCELATNGRSNKLFVDVQVWVGSLGVDGIIEVDLHIGEKKNLNI